MNSLIIETNVIKAIIEHALCMRPVEACGYLAGKDGRVTSFKPLRNIDESGEHFALEPGEQFDAVRELRAGGLNVLAVYHSHPASPARPSQEDIRLAYDPDIHYVIVSLEGGSTNVKSFRIRSGGVEEEIITVV